MDRRKRLLLLKKKVILIQKQQREQRRRWCATGSAVWFGFGRYCRYHRYAVVQRVGLVAICNFIRSVGPGLCYLHLQYAG
ncbi:hypothetical protein MRX96_057714 [Rhipicephalus microplus]